MANPIIPGILQTEQDLLYSKLNAYNQGRASYKEVGAYLVVLPRPEHLQYTLWIYSPLPGRQSIFYICDLSTDIHETLRMASTLCFYSPRSLLLVEYNAKRMQSKGDDIISIGKYHGHFLHDAPTGLPDEISEVMLTGRDLRIERTGHADLKVAIAHCETVGDFGSRELLEDILESEEEHIDWLETQLGLIDKIGIENYLQSQMGDDE